MLIKKYSGHYLFSHHSNFKTRLASWSLTEFFSVLFCGRFSWRKKYLDFQSLITVTCPLQNTIWLEKKCAHVSVTYTTRTFSCFCYVLFLEKTLYYRNVRLRAQSFTSLMADLRQHINRISSFNRCLIEHFLKWIAPLRHWYMNPNEKSNKSSLLSKLTKPLTEHSLQGNIPLIPLLNAKPPFNVYVLTEICLQLSLTIGP